MDKNLTKGKNVKIKYARLVVPYDNAAKGEGLKALDKWLTKVEELNSQVVHIWC